MKKLALLFPLILLISCASSQVDSTVESSYFNEHAALVASLPNTALVSDPGEKLEMVLGDFKTTLTEENLRNLYAEDLYFNDTFVTLNTIDELVAYMQKTADSTIAATVEITDVSKSDTDYYVRWSMDMEFMARNKRIKSRSIGVTQLRFNEQGKVVLHQDYWDSANAFYQHLPIIGGLVKRVKNGLH